MVRCRAHRSEIYAAELTLSDIRPISRKHRRKRNMPDDATRTHTRDRSLRAADRDREATADLLRREHLAGRLTSDEWQQRLDRCLTAKTYTELDELVLDLPPDDHDTRERHRGRLGARRWPRPLRLLPFLAAVLIVAVAIDIHAVWLAIPFAFFFVVRPLVWSRRARAFDLAHMEREPRARTLRGCG
jgi:Flp pilus assembly protein TadB